MKKQFTRVFVVVILLFTLFSSCDTPYKIIETYTTDSAGRTVKTIQKIYPDGATTPVASINVVSSPWYNSGYYNPYYYYYYTPRTIVPTRPIYIPRIIPPHRH